jgi:glucosamine 6-phosphate synthetase-like amidotransferase/phosphosugar isomerase protein
MLEILGETNPESKLKRFDDLCASKTVQDFYASAQKDYSAIFDVAVKEDFDKKYFFSNEKNIFIELMGKEYDQQRLIIAKALDSISEQVDVSEFEHSVQDFLSLIKNTISNNRNAYSIACGTSFHATKIAALFFNEIAKID